MKTDLVKLFIGGISWDTDEKGLKEYFGQHGEVVEAVIVRDRITGRARGFGFVIFADPTVAERVVMEKHLINGRTVEAKKAVPREDQHILTRNNNNIQGSTSPGHVRKIFVGGLASSVTESDFKKYFDQFGTIKDVVVMYDHKTQKPRGFGFITYDSEDAVDRVLHKTFHELNGKIVEVKRAVPKELSPSPNRSPIVGYNSYGLSRLSNLINSYPQGYNLSSVGGYGRFNLVAGGRSGLQPFGASGCGMNTNVEPVLSVDYGTNSGFGNSPGRLWIPYFSGKIGRYNSSVGYSGGNARRNDSLCSSTSRNFWGNGSFNNSMNPTNYTAFLGFGGGNIGGSLGAHASNWSSSPITSHAGKSASGVGNLGYGLGDSNYELGGAGYGRNTDSNAILVSSFAAPIGTLDSSYGDLYSSSSVYGETTTGVPEVVSSGSFGFGLANAGSEVASKTSEGRVGS